MSKAERLKNVLIKNGICVDCGEPFIHDITEPFATCDCGTTEWPYDHNNPNELPTTLRLQHLLHYEKEKSASLLKDMSRLQVASCTCLTKTHVAYYHEPWCFYKRINSLLEEYCFVEGNNNEP